MTKSLIELYNSFGEIKENDWLNGRSFFDAFVLCIASGPWRVERRLKIQTEAISFISGRDLSQINSKINLFPLSWQNKFLNCIINTLKLSNFTMDKFCKLIQKEIIIKNNNQILYNACQCPNGAKVLSLFCRDQLKISNCFPIDRHVKSFLKERNLPQKENEMIKLCIETDINPRLFALGIAQSIGIKNPNWSIK